MKKICLFISIIFALGSCKKNMDCGSSTTTYYGARMANNKDFRIVDDKNLDVFKSGLFQIDSLKLISLEDGTPDELDFTYSSDAMETYYIINAPVSYTVDGFPLVLDYGTGRTDTITFKEIGFNSCTGPILREELSSGIKSYDYTGKITLN